MKIIFYGTPEFAVPSLDILVENGKNVIAVVTAPDKPAGRGRQLKASDVKEAASRHGIPVLQPVKLKDADFQKKLQELQPDVQIVVAFRMMPESVWKLPSKGTFNLHGSLLPQYRGAAPINWAIINGERKTGVTTFFLQQEIDTGNIIFTDELEIGSDENVSSLHDRMKIVGAKLVLKTLEAIENGPVPTRPQDAMVRGELKAAPKLNKENTRIHFTSDPHSINNLVRGLSLFPGAHCEMVKLNGDVLPVKFYYVKSHLLSHSKVIGSIETDEKTYLDIYVSGGKISVIEMQLPGKSRMKIREVLNGNKFEQGTLFR